MEGSSSFDIIRQTDHLQEGCLGEYWPPSVLLCDPTPSQRNLTGAGGGEGRSVWVSSALKGSLTVVMLPTEAIRNLLSSEVPCVDYFFKKYLLRSYYV